MRSATLRLACLGDCPDSRALLQAAAGDPAWQIVRVLETDADAPDLQRFLESLVPDAPTLTDWETALVGDPLDAVIVAGQPLSPQAEGILRRVAQEGLPALVVHPACEAILAYELDMILRDTRGLLLPYFPGVGHPAVSRLRDLRRFDGEPSLGTIQQLTWERTVRSQDPAALTTDFVRDMHLTRKLVGEIQEVSGLGNRDPSQGPLNLSVNLKSHDNQPVRWMTRALHPGLAARLTVESERGRATLSIFPGDRPWHLRVDPRVPIPADTSQADSVYADPGQEFPGQEFPGQADSGQAGSVYADPGQEFPGWDGPVAALGRLREALAGRVQGADWADACRDLEIADALNESLRRARTIQLYHEEHTEEGSFKGIMAVGGCALLLLGLLLLFAFAIVEGFRGSTPPEWPPADQVSSGTPDGTGASGQTGRPGGAARLPLIIRLWPVYPFALFLLLQLLRMVFRDTPGRSERTASHRGPKASPRSRRAGEADAEASATAQPDTSRTDRENTSKGEF